MRRYVHGVAINRGYIPKGYLAAGGFRLSAVVQRNKANDCRYPSSHCTEPFCRPVPHLKAANFPQLRKIELPTLECAEMSDFGQRALRPHPKIGLIKLVHSIAGDEFFRHRFPISSEIELADKMGEG